MTIGSNSQVIPDIARLRKYSQQPCDGKKPLVRVALLADTSSQLLAVALRGYARYLSFNLDLFEADFNQIELAVLDPQSSLHAFAPETVIIYLSGEKIGAEFGTCSITERQSFAARFMDRVRSLHAALSNRGCQVLFFNLTDPGISVFGHYGSKVAWSLENQIRQCNCELGRFACEANDFHVYDLAALQTRVGRATLFDPKLYFTSKFALTPAVLPIVASDVVKMLMARKGSFLKCIILDLDNTLWGGVVGDDGIDHIQLGELGLGPAFMAFQAWLKQLRDRGIVLAVCSKNDDANAREPFLKHPDMVLRLDDIAVFVANWNDKATNIRTIKNIIDVDFSAMMFLDDNPVERQLVRESFPTMMVPDLPEDPCEYVSCLAYLNAFEAGSYTPQDVHRTQEYQSEAQRHTEREKFVDLADFLRTLEMRALVRPFLPFNIPRVAQLTQRSNQFNLRTVRYTEKQITELMASPAHVTLAFELKDRFGDSGLISVVILETRTDEVFVDTWLMSCRVLGRGMEHYVLNTIVQRARALRVKQVRGEYLPTAKNGMVKDHYAKLGFVADNGHWVLSVEDYCDRPVFIQTEHTEDGAETLKVNGAR